VMRRRFQRLGPNAGGGAERGLGGCWSGDLVVVCRAAGTAAGWPGVGSAFPVAGRGCATRVLRRGGRRVVVLLRLPQQVGIVAA
jgi:hypothetical protein